MLRRIDLRGEKGPLKDRLPRPNLEGEAPLSAVRELLREVREGGDVAIRTLTHRFDGVDIDTPLVEERDLRKAWQSLDVETAEALQAAHDRILHFQQEEAQPPRTVTQEGITVTSVPQPMERVGVYVPGGKANYPSSLLMLAIPAQVAGVKEIIATVPTAYGDEGQLVFAAASLAGISQLYTIGGAQAIAALAFGTETVPCVDKITGPGNIYVTAAKKQVYGEVGIDMLAGPSELTIICDGTTDPNWIAMDLFSQAEHDEQAQSILISTCNGFLDDVQASINKLLPNMDRREIIKASLVNRGIFILAEDIEKAAVASNIIAPEHLEISVDAPEAVLSYIENAGAIFLGRYTAESLGDYCAGPSHVLPTSGTAKFSSVLGVYDFQKRSSVINCSPAGAKKLAITAAELARNENLEAHALSAEYRLEETFNSDKP